MSTCLLTFAHKHLTYLPDVRVDPPAVVTAAVARSGVVVFVDDAELGDEAFFEWEVAQRRRVLGRHSVSHSEASIGPLRLQWRTSSQAVVDTVVHTGSWHCTALL